MLGYEPRELFKVFCFFLILGHAMQQAGLHR